MDPKFCAYGVEKWFTEFEIYIVYTYLRSKRTSTDCTGYQILDPRLVTKGHKLNQSFHSTLVCYTLVSKQVKKEQVIERRIKVVIHDLYILIKRWGLLQANSNNISFISNITIFFDISLNTYIPDQIATNQLPKLC